MVKKEKENVEVEEKPGKTIEQMNEIQRSIFLNISSNLGVYPDNTNVLRQVIYVRMNEIAAKIQEQNIGMSNLNGLLKHLEMLEA